MSDAVGLKPDRNDCGAAARDHLGRHTTHRVIPNRAFIATRRRRISTDIRKGMPAERSGGKGAIYIVLGRSAAGCADLPLLGSAFLMMLSKRA